MIVRRKRKGKSMFFFDFFDFSDLIYLILFKNTISNEWQQFPKALYHSSQAVARVTSHQESADNKESHINQSLFSSSCTKKIPTLYQWMSMSSSLLPRALATPSTHSS